MFFPYIGRHNSNESGKFNKSEGIPGTSIFTKLAAHLHHMLAGNAKMKNTRPLCRARPKLRNQFHLDSALPLERLEHFAVYNSNTRWISKAINHSRQGTAQQL